MRTWPGLLLAPALVLADQSVTYALVGWSCANQMHGIAHVVHAGFLLAVLATMVAARGAQRAAAAVRDERPRFMAQLALLLAALSAAVIVAMWIPQGMLSPCYG